MRTHAHRLTAAIAVLCTLATASGLAPAARAGRDRTHRATRVGAYRPESPGSGWQSHEDDEAPAGKGETRTVRRRGREQQHGTAPAVAEAAQRLVMPIAASVPRPRPQDPVCGTVVNPLAPGRAPPA